MQIQVVAVGKLKEKYLKMAVEEYQKRLSGYCKLDIIEVPDEPVPENASPAQEEQAKAKEAQRISRYLEGYKIALAIEGKQLPSEGLAQKFESLALGGQSKISFLIGGSVGLDRTLISQADHLLSLSMMTFPHQLTRVILLEQIYRAFRIIRHEPYHK